MKRLAQFGAGMALVAFAAAADSASQSPDKPSWGRILEAARQNGYDEGYLAGYDTARGGNQLKQCEMLLHLSDDQGAVCKRQASCLDELKSAAYGTESYLRQVAFRCTQGGR